MEKKIEIILLIILVIFSFGTRTITLDTGTYFGADAFFHYSIVEQNLKQGKLTGHNDLDLCYDGVKAGHPIGFYAMPYYLSYIIGLQNAFNLTPVIAGVITIILLYYLTSMLFSKEIGMIAAFILAGLNAHLARSVALVYRGDNLILPFVLGSLMLALMFLKEENLRKKAYYALAAGLVTGIAPIVWNGAALALGIFNIAIASYIVFDYLFKKDVRINLMFSSLALLIQVVLAQVIARRFLTNFKEFYLHGYLIYFVGPFMLLFIMLEIGQRFSKKHTMVRYSPFIAIILGGVIAVLTKKDKIDELISGFGMITPTTTFHETIQELKPLTTDYFWFHMWIIAIFAAIGLIIIAMKWNNKRMILWAMALPMTYMMISSKRFVFFASIPFAMLSGLSIHTIMKGFEKMVDKRILVIIPLAIVLLSAYHGVNSINTLLIPRAQPDLENALKSFGQTSPEDACMIATWEKGGMVQYYSKRHSYTSSVGGQSIPRINKSNTFLLTDKNIYFGKGNYYILVQEEDLMQILSMNQLTNVGGIGGSLLSREDQKDTPEYGELLLRSDASADKFMVRQSKTGNQSVSAFRVQDGKLLPVKTLIINQDSFSVSFSTDRFADPGCVYIGNKLMAHFSSALCSSNMIQMLAGNDIEDMEKTYMQKGVSIYHLISSSRSAITPN